MTLKAIMHKNPERLLDQLEVADILRISPRTLEYYRAKGLGPKFIRIGKLARYALSDVQAYIEQLVKG